MQNFNINIPTIPSKRILFKIQNNQLKGFTQKEARFKDNMSYLQRHFVQSFPNLHPASPKSPKEEDQNRSRMSTKVSTNQSSGFCRGSEDYRMVVPDNKKNLLIKYEEQYKHYLPKVERDFSLHKGYSFGKSIRDTLDEQLKKYPCEKMDRSNDKSKIIDNYFFNTEESEQEDQIEKIELEKRRQERLAKKNMARRSAVFESEDRWRSLERELDSKIKVGPGTYAVTEEKKSVEKKRKDRVTIPTMKLEKVMELLEDKQEPNPEAQISHKEASAVKRSSMFFEGNTDRFGKQIYPISPALNVPGPGAYKYEDSLEDKANRILVLEEQRKLLKEWYNS